MKIKKPIIHRLNENDLEVVESYYQCLFNKTPLDIFEIKNNTIDECKFEKIDFSKINLTNTHFVDCIFINCDLSNISFEKISIHRCHFINCKMIGVGFINCSLKDVLFEDIQGKYVNIALGSISKKEVKEGCLDESSIMETKIKNLEFNGVSFINGEIFKTNLQDMDFKSTNIEGIKIDIYSLKGIHVDMYQAVELSRLLGIIVD